jgi:hypothetical protein
MSEVGYYAACSATRLQASCFPDLTAIKAPLEKEICMIDVHIGFMDEEVSELLRCLIKTSEGMRPVIAIERGKVSEEDFLFEAPFSKYVNKDEKVEIIHVEHTTNKSPLEKLPDFKAPLENRLAHHLYTNSKSDFFDHKIKGKALESVKVKSKSIETPFSVIRFNPTPEVTEDPIILIRNPEMGAQPSIVRPYERAILKAISRLEEARLVKVGENRLVDIDMIDEKEARLVNKKALLPTGIRLFSFASGGAIIRDLPPGSVTRPLASLYIGAEVDEQGRVYSAVNLIALRRIRGTSILLPQHIEFFREESITTFASDDPSGLNTDQLKQARKEANAEAQSYILNSNDTLPVEILKYFRGFYAEYDNYEPVELDGKILSSAKPEITASFSYFDDLKTKEALSERFAGAVLNSNMEDYHVLRLAKSMRERGGFGNKSGNTAHKYGRLIDVGIMRVNANVFIPVEEIHAPLKRYLERACLTKQEYVESIIWGLKGCPLELVEELPRRVKCWEFYNDSPMTDRQKYFYTYKGIYCMDPFCCEIATDFLKDLEDSSNKFLPDLMGEAKALRNEAKKLTRAGINDEGWERIRHLVMQLLDKVEASGFGINGADGKMYCWLRSEKWGDIKQATLTPDLVSKFLASGENVDRLFYKSANLLALQTLAQNAANRSAIPKTV